MNLVNAQYITASVFINDDERGLHNEYEKWLEEVRSRLRPAPHAPVSHCRPTGRSHNRTGQACPRQAPVLDEGTGSRRPPEADRISPELNAQEDIWQHMRRRVTHNRYFEHIDVLLEAVEQLHRELQHEPEQVLRLLKKRSRVIVS